MKLPFQLTLAIALCCFAPLAGAQNTPASPTSLSSSRRPRLRLTSARKGISKDVKTPNIDSIAAKRRPLHQRLRQLPRSALPTRAGLMTGRYQQRFGFEWNPKGAVRRA
jgi:hypothetical protein